MRFQFTILFCATAWFLLFTMFFAPANTLAIGFLGAGTFLAAAAALPLPFGSLISSSDSDDESSSLSTTGGG
jgi:hypothetical protein